MNIPLPDNGIPIRKGDTHYIYKDVYHPITWIGDEPYRPRVETLVVKDGKLIFLRMKDKDNLYELPGGSIDADSSPIEQAENETNEEALLSIKDIYDTGIQYYEQYPGGFILNGGDTPLEYTGHITNVFVANFAGLHDKRSIEKKDLDPEIADNGKFYKISDVATILKEPHINALLNSPYVNQTTKSVIRIYQRMNNPETKKKNLKSLSKEDISEKLIFLSDIRGLTVSPKPELTNGGKFRKIEVYRTIKDALIGYQLNNKKEWTSRSNPMLFVYSIDCPNDMEIYIPSGTESESSKITSAVWIKTDKCIKDVKYLGIIQVFTDGEVKRFYWGKHSVFKSEYVECTYKWISKNSMTHPVVESTIVPGNRLYHGSTYEITEFEPMSLNLGNAMERPGWCTFAFAEYNLALRFGLMRAIQKATGYWNKDVTCTWDIIESKPFISDKDFKDINDLIQGFRFFVYTIDASNLNVGIGNDDRLSEYTFDDRGIRPEKTDALRIDSTMLRDHLLIIPDKEMSMKIKQQETMAKYHHVRGWYSAVMTKDYNGGTASAALQSAVSKGYLKPGDDIEEYMNTHGLYFENDSVNYSTMQESVSSKLQNDFKPNGKKSLSSLKKIPLTDITVKTYKSKFKMLSHVRTGANVEGYIYIDDNDCAMISVETKANGVKWIQALEITKGLQGYGLSKQLLDVATKDLGATFLSVNKKNEVAINIYKKNGWKVSDSTDSMFYMHKGPNSQRLVQESILGDTPMKSTVVDGFKKKSPRKLSSFKKLRITPSIANKYKHKTKALRNMDPSEQGYVFVDNDGEFVAVVVVEVDNKNATGDLKDYNWITYIEVDEKYKGCGLSRQLLDIAVKDLGGDFLTVTYDNEVAIRLYKSYGFKISKYSYDSVKSGKSESKMYTMFYKNRHPKNVEFVNESTKYADNISFASGKEYVVEIIDSLPMSEKKFIGNHVDEGFSRQFVSHTKNLKDREVLLVDDVPVAFLDVYTMPDMSPNEGTIVLAVRSGSKYRRQGYGSILVERMQNRITKKTGITKLIWEYDNDNVKSGMMGITLGFKKERQGKLSKTLESVVSTEEDYVFEVAQYSSINKYPVFITLMHTGTKMATLIKTVTGDEFSHATIAFNSKLHPTYSFGTKKLGGKERGLVVQNPQDEFFNSFKTTYATYVMYVSRDQRERMLNRLQYFIDNEPDLKYDAPALVACALHIPTEFRTKWFCSRFVAEILNQGDKLSKVPSLWKPQELTGLENISLVNSGNDFRRYDYKLTNKNLEFIKNGEYDKIQAESTVCESKDIFESGDLSEYAQYADLDGARDDVQESTLFSKKDIYHKFDDFVDGKSNVLFVTGLSGSGKSTISEQLARKYNAIYIELDLFGVTSGRNDIKLPKDVKTIYDECIKENPSIKTKENAQFLYGIIQFILKWADSHKNKKYIIEGVQLADLEMGNELIRYPMIIKGTSVVKSVYNASIRREHMSIRDIIKYVPDMIKDSKDFDGVVDNLRKLTESSTYSDTTYRITYDGDGIYNALKNNVSPQTWGILLNSKSMSWLPKPPFYAKNNLSYFTRDGYDMFMKNVMPIVKQHLDPDKIKVETFGDLCSVCYSDKYQVVTESAIFSKDDIRHNIELWESKENNILLITGLSGSGKTTTAYDMSHRYKAEVFQLDWVEHYENMCAKQNGYDYGLRQYIYNKHRSQLLNSHNLTGDGYHMLVLDIFESILEFAQLNPTKLFIIEGAQIPGHLHDYPNIESFPIIIKGTSMIKSSHRRFMRDTLKNALKTGNANILKYYLDAEKYMNMFRDQITQESLTPITEAPKAIDGDENGDNPTDYTEDADIGDGDQTDTGETDGENTEETPTDYTEDAENDNPDEQNQDTEEPDEDSEGDGSSGEDQGEEPTDYTEDSDAGDITEDGDGTEDDSSDTASNTEEDSESENPYDNNVLKNYSLLKNFEKLYELTKEVSDSLDSRVEPTKLQNTVLAQVLKNMNSIKEFIVSYVKFQFAEDNYPQNRYYYDIVVQSLKSNLKLLKLNKKLGEIKK